MRHVNIKFMLIACERCFNGDLMTEVASDLGVTPGTIANWKRHPIWKDFEAELIDAHKQAILQAHRPIAPNTG